MVITVEETNDWNDTSSKYDHSPFLDEKFLEAFKNDILNPTYLIFKENGKVIGGIAGLEYYPDIHVLRKMKIFKSLTFYTGPFLTKGKIYKDCWKKLIQYIKNEGYSKMKIIGFDISKKPYSHIEGFRIKKNLEFIINLDDEWDNINKKIRKDIKRKIRKAQQAGLSYMISNDPKMVDTLDELIDQTVEFRKKRGLTDFKKDYIPYLDDQVMKKQIKNGIAHFFYVNSDEGILSIRYLINNESQAYGLYIGTTERGYELGANTYNYYKTMEYLWELGIKSYNLGGTPRMAKEGLVQYKLGLGAIPMETWSLFSPIIKEGLGGIVLRVNERFRKESF